MHEPLYNSPIAFACSPYRHSLVGMPIESLKFAEMIGIAFVSYHLNKCPGLKDITENLSIIRLHESVWFMRKVDFITMRIRPEMKDHFTQWANDNRDDYIDLKTTLQQEGYKFSQSYDAERDCFIAAMTGTSKCKYNKSLCFTTRSDDFFECEMMALYKHIIMADMGDWQDVAESRDNWG